MGNVGFSYRLELRDTVLPAPLAHKKPFISREPVDFRAGSGTQDNPISKTIPSMYPKSLLARTVGLVAGLATIGAAQSAVTVTNFRNIAPPGADAGTLHDPSIAGGPDLLSASSSDLVHGSTPTVTYTLGGNPVVENLTTMEDSAGVSTWTDGSITTVYGAPGFPFATSHAAYGTIRASVGATDYDVFVTFDLGGLHDLDQIDVFLGWNDSGRDDSSFNLLVSVDGISFTSVAGYDKGADDTGAHTAPVTNLHRFTDDGGAALAQSVRYVQLHFTDADNGFAGMAEVDIFGTAVPEPAAPMLLGLGSLLGLSRRQRRPTA